MYVWYNVYLRYTYDARRRFVRELRGFTVTYICRKLCSVHVKEFLYSSLYPMGKWRENTYHTWNTEHSVYLVYWFRAYRVSTYIIMSRRIRKCSIFAEYTQYFHGTFARSLRLQILEQMACLLIGCTVWDNDRYRVTIVDILIRWV